MFKKWREEKKEYRIYRKRVDALPEAYRKAMQAIEHYMWHFAKGAGMFALVNSILEMFESSANDGLHVREVVGDDIAAFADSLLAEFPEETWMDKMRKKLRESVE